MPDTLTGEETPDDAFRRVAAGQVRLWRRIALVALFGALSYTIVVTIAAIIGTVWVVHFVDRQDTSAQTSSCRSSLAAEYDDQQSKFLDAADLRLADARVAARSNMRVIVAARKKVKDGVCPSVTLQPVSIPGQ